MPPAADRVTGDSEQRQDRADHHGDDAERPDNGDLPGEADDEENHIENAYPVLLAVSSRPPGQRHEGVLDIRRSARWPDGLR